MKLVSAVCASAAVLFLAGCYHYPYAYTTPGVAFAAPATAVVTTSPAVVASIPGNMVCYDQFYGQIVSGFWGSDGNFHYQLVAGGPWLIDTGRHFRRTCVTGFQSVAILPPANGAVIATDQPAASTVFYDQFYGPITTGYWGSDGMFHYRLVANGPWLIDRARHFRRNAAAGFTVVTIAPLAIPPA